eukprot:1087502-Rhodomonas_salina.1
MLAGWINRSHAFCGIACKNARRGEDEKAGKAAAGVVQVRKQRPCGRLRRQWLSGLLFVVALLTCFGCRWDDDDDDDEPQPQVPSCCPRGA